MALDPTKNFAFSTVATAPSPALSGTTLTVATGHGARFDDPAVVGDYNVVLFPEGQRPYIGNAEIVRFTAKAGDVFTITREQESTTAKTIIVGYEVMWGATSKMWDDLLTTFMSSFTLTADSGSNQTIANSNTLDIEGGNGIDTVVGATDKVTIGIATDGVDDTMIDWGTGANQVSQDDVVDGATYVQTHNDYTDADKTVVGNTSGENTGDDPADDTAYNATSWNDNTDSATKNAIRDKVETMDTAIGLNTAKDTNVPTELSTGTVNGTSYGITSDGGADDVVLAQADTNNAGVLSAAKWDEIVANSLKNTNVPTELSTGTVNGTSYGITSDGSTDDIVLAAATTDDAGLLTAALFDEIDANTAKVSFDSTSSTKLGTIEESADVTDTDNVTSAGALMDSEVDVDIKTLVLPASTTISAFGKTLVDDAAAVNARATLDVDQAGTDNSTDVTIGTANGLSLAAQALSLALSSTSTTGSLSDTDWDTFNDKVSNVTTNLSEGTSTATTVDVNSSDGSNATLVSASTSRAGLLTKAKWDEIVANSLKATNVPTALSIGTKAATTLAITSDGGADDVTLPAADTDYAGLMTDAQFDKLAGIEASANNYTHPNHSGEVTSTGDGATVIASSIVDEDNLKLDEAPTNDHVLTADDAKSGGMKWAASSGGFADPMTTRGDVIYKDASNVTNRLGVGTNGQALMSDGTDVAWATPAGSGNVSTSGTPVDNDFAKFVGGTDIEGRSYTEVKQDLDLEIGTDVLAQQTIGIANDNLVEIDDADAADNDYAKFTANGLEGRSATEVRSDISVEENADVTDTDNVTSAGALMDSEVDADIKTLDLPANTTISAYGKTLVDDADASTARGTLDVDQAGTDNSTDVTIGTANGLSLSTQELSLALSSTSTTGALSDTDWDTFNDKISFDSTSSTKLGTIEESADVTDTTNVNAAGATMNADTTMAGNGYFLDQDNLSNDSATKVASQQSVKAYVDNSGAGNSGGWIPVTSSYSIGSDSGGLDVIQLLGDATGSLSVGMRIKVTQDSTVYYGIIHKLVYGSPYTLMSVFLSVTSGTRNRLNANAVSNFYYSREKIPYGFPSDVASWTLSKTKTTDSSISNPASGSTYYNLSSDTNLLIPLGEWEVGYQGEFTGSGGDTGRYASLGISSSGYLTRYNAFAFGYAHHSVSCFETLTAETTYYLNMRRNGAMTSMGTVTGDSAMGLTYVYAINNYL